MAKESFYLEYGELEDLPDTAWFIDKLFPLGGLSLIFSPPNLGKSLMALDMALRISKGKNWGGRETVMSDVLYVATEGARSAVRDRVRAWQQFNSDHANIDNVVWYTRDIKVLPKRMDEHELDQVIQGAMDLGYWPEFVIIDTLNYAIDGDENDNTHMGEVAKHLNGLKNKEWTDSAGVVRDYNPTILLVHHTPKSDSRTARGAGALEGAVDSSLMIEEVMSGSKPIERLMAVSNKKNRYASRGSEWYFTIRDDEHDGLAIGATLEYTPKDKLPVAAAPKTVRIKEAILYQLSFEPLTTGQLDDILSDEFGQNAAGKNTTALAKAGKIHKESRNAPWQLSGINQDLTGL